MNASARAAMRISPIGYCLRCVSSLVGMRRRKREAAEMNKSHRGTARSDALVLFGVTGDLAHKMIFPALYAMAKRGVLNVPVVGVASPPWSLAQLRQRAEDGIRHAGRIDDRRTLRHLLSRLGYVAGDY